MRYALGVFGIIVVALIAIILIFSRPNSNSNTSKTASKGPAVVKLLEYDNSDSAVKAITQGQLVGEDQRRSIRITVTQSQRTIDVIQGYEQNVIKSESFPNTPAAYSTFLHALENSGFTRYRKGVTAEERGACPLGNRYVYELNKGSQQLQRLWGSSCSNGDGSFAGSGPRIRQMFQDQITDYNKFVSDVQLSR